MARERTIPAVIFANAKGGVGKSTLALLTALCMAAQGKRICFIDLDQQKSGEKSLARFIGDGRIDVAHVEWPGRDSYEAYERLFDPTHAIDNDRFDLIVIDTPAGIDPDDLLFLSAFDLILIPTSSSDMDLNATQRFVGRLLQSGAMQAGERRTLQIMLAPNMIDDLEDLRQVRTQIRTIGTMPPVHYSADVRRAMQSYVGEMKIVEAIRANKEFFSRLMVWLTQAQTRADLASRP
ncbi:hypothetical protein JCM17846_03240 [Iodidimonas nitroreducens]|uniref:CobQ/CobB/MinD/ParA nucleotide binding domain-containing protein n=1 Tax=Iodidimonas nitroreducens TaxID=1236968 RepID=A0A5A7N2Z2_9PROT|nr:ParA family protein [Iodidimonas nitroreducens]GAK32191.1 arsenical pump-driving ATPase [alpha proteobacterium Q-1]GER02642.1 hypothetical protein JCM17846_03240 [Iodidimonas nitroreducens]